MYLGGGGSIHDVSVIDYCGLARDLSVAWKSMLIELLIGKSNDLQK